MDDGKRNVDVTRMSPISYEYAHKKVRRARGKATEHACISCGRQASQWSYNHGDEHEQSEMKTRTTRGKVSTSYVAWSPNVFAYDPMCVPCHSKKDKGAA